MSNINLIKNRLLQNLIQQAESLKQSTGMTYEEKIAMMEEISKFTKYIQAYEQDNDKITYLEELER